MITIKEIADMVGVSTTTVSNVIHGKTKKVSDENIEKIKKVLDEMNYIPRMGLSSLTNRSSHIIGVVVHIAKHYENTILSDPFYGQVVGYLEKYIRESGYYMMLYTSENVDDIFRMAMAWNVDGLVAITFTYESYHQIKALVKKPIVAIDLYNEPDNDYINIGLDDEDGGYQMTSYLLESGFKNILILANRDVGVDHQRILGYKRALNDFGVPFDASHFIQLPDNSTDRENTFSALLKYAKQDYALFFLSDLLASEAMRFFIAKGFAIPDDFSIVGFDDNLYAKCISPQLTSVHQDVGLKAQKAVEVLIKLFNAEALDEKHIILPVHLAIRDSVKPKK